MRLRLVACLTVRLALLGDRFRIQRASLQDADQERRDGDVRVFAFARQGIFRHAGFRIERRTATAVKFQEVTSDRS